MANGDSRNDVRGTSDRNRGVESAREAPRFRQPSRMRVVGPLQRDRLIIEFDQPTGPQHAAEMIFKGGSRPQEYGLLPETSDYRRWAVVLPPSMNVMSATAHMHHRIVEQVASLAMPRVLTAAPGTAAREREAHRRRLEWVADIMGVTVSAVFDNPGWYESHGYFIYVGHNPRTGRTMVQAQPLSTSEAVNRDIRWYLDIGMSLDDAVRALSEDTSLAMKIAASRGIIPVDTYQKRIQDRMTAADRAIERTLTADLAAVEAAVRDLIAQMAEGSRGDG